MARPRVFISSTFFDLRQVRADLELAIKEIGYETILNEKGDIAYGNKDALQTYCYREISQIDILVGIIGGRFGSEGESEYSVTQSEIRTALKENKQVYLFIEKSVHAEYGTYLVNKETANMKYSYVNDVRVYKFIEEIKLLKKNNTIQSFETSNDIIFFLKAQWAGLFKELLRQEVDRQQAENMSIKVEELTNVAETLKTYLENIVTQVNPKNAVGLIDEENKKLDIRKRDFLKKLPYIKHLQEDHELQFEDIEKAVYEGDNLEEIRWRLIKFKPKNKRGIRSQFRCIRNPKSIRDINQMRSFNGKSIFMIDENGASFFDEDEDSNLVSKN